MCPREQFGKRLSLEEVTVTESQFLVLVWDVPGRFGAVKDEGKLSLKGDREMCPGVIQEITPNRSRNHGMVWLEGILKIILWQWQEHLPQPRLFQALPWNTCRDGEGWGDLLCAPKVKLLVESALVVTVQICPKLSLALGLNPSFHQELVVPG